MHGVVLVSVPRERTKPKELLVSWTSKPEKLNAVKKAVCDWARSERGWWGVSVDTTKIHSESVGTLYINHNVEKAHAQFALQIKGTATPPPVDALFAVDGGSR